VIIIGGGPAGYTAALYSARANLNPLVIEGFNWGGQLMITSDVENYPGYADGVMGPVMMQDFRRQAERFGAEFLTDDVTRVDFSERPRASSSPRERAPGSSGSSRSCGCRAAASPTARPATRPSSATRS
jgi:thioredoxin reductase (NADPH)